MKTHSRLIPHLVVAALFSITLTGCWRSEAEYQRLVDENKHLKTELDKALHPDSATKPAEGQASEASLNVDINELWSQRFEDNEFRAKQRLSDKIIRLTGTVDDVTSNSITLFGSGKKFSNVRMTVSLNEAHANKVRDGLAMIGNGVTVTVQGKFAYDLMRLNDAVFVDRESGRVLSVQDVAKIGSSPLPNPKGSEQAWK